MMARYRAENWEGTLERAVPPVGFPGDIWKLLNSFLGPIYLGSNLRRADLGKLRAANRGGSGGGG